MLSPPKPTSGVVETSLFVVAMVAMGILCFVFVSKCSTFSSFAIILTRMALPCLPDCTRLLVICGSSLRWLVGSVCVFPGHT